MWKRAISQTESRGDLITTAHLSLSPEPGLATHRDEREVPASDKDVRVAVLSIDVDSGERGHDGGGAGLAVNVHGSEGSHDRSRAGNAVNIQLWGSIDEERIKDAEVLKQWQKACTGLMPNAET